MTNSNQTTSAQILNALEEGVEYMEFATTYVNTEVDLMREILEKGENPDNQIKICAEVIAKKEEIEKANQDLLELLNSAEIKEAIQTLKEVTDQMDDLDIKIGALKFQAA